MARVCVELDLANPLPNRLWIGTGDSGLWQPITYENIPEYCTDCNCLGHATGCCSNAKSDPVEKMVWRPKNPQPQLPDDHLRQESIVPPQNPSTAQTNDHSKAPNVSLVNQSNDHPTTLVDHSLENPVDLLPQDDSLPSSQIDASDSELKDFSLFPDRSLVLPNKDDSSLVLYRSNKPDDTPLPRTQSATQLAVVPLDRIEQTAQFQAFSLHLTTLLNKARAVAEDAKRARKRRQLPLERTMITRSQHAATLSLPSND